MTTPLIREAGPDDLQALLDVNRQAFGSDEEADLVQKLLRDPSAEPALSLVAEKDRQLVGHILFTNARLTPDTPHRMALLAPLSVVPSAQGRGIGGRLIETGAQMLREDGVELIFVLGHTGYYPRHGFTPAGVFDLQATYPIPEEHADAWMLRPLKAGIEGSISGRVLCADTLQDPKYWVE